MGALFYQQQHCCGIYIDVHKRFVVILPVAIIMLLFVMISDMPRVPS